MKNYRVLMIACALFAVSCSVSTIHHDEDKAAAIAEEASRIGFVSKDFGEFRKYLVSDLADAYPGEILGTEISKLHPTGFPNMISATEFEPLPGKAAMNILLVGSGGSEQFYYRMLMIGNAESGYKVGGFFRGNKPYPSSKLKRPL